MVVAWRRAVAALAAFVIGVLCAVSLPVPAEASEGPTSLPLASFEDLVVDPAHGHVFVSGGGGIAVRDLDGGPVTSIPEQTSASKMVLSDDRTRLYAALPDAGAIVAIDTTSLMEVARYDVGTTTCPSSVAVTPGRVWFGYETRSYGGCPGHNNTGNLGVIDVSSAPAAVSLGQLPGHFYGAPLLLGAPVLAGRLLAAEPDTSSGHVELLDVSGDTPTLVTSRNLSSIIQDWGLGPDASHVFVAANPHYTVLRTSDLTIQTTYGAGVWDPNAVAGTADGLFAAGQGEGHEDGPDIRIYEAAGAEVRPYEMGGCCESGKSGTLAPGGLAFGADRSRLFAVTTDYMGEAVALRVLRDVGRYPSRITLGKPSGAVINKAFAISGSLSSSLSIPPGATVTVQRDSTYGKVSLPSRTVAADGSFALTDTVSKRGTYGYTVAWAGDDSHAGTATRVAFFVKGLATTVTITTSAGPYSYGARPVVVAHLGASRSRTVSLYATPYEMSRRLIKTGTVDARGNLSVPYTMSRRTVFTVVFKGDDTYEPRSYAKTLTSRARLLASLAGGYATSGGYRLFHDEVDPRVPVSVSPNNVHRCVSFVAQHYASGSWRTVATQPCLELEYDSTTLAVFSGPSPVGGRYRIRPTFNGSTSNVKTVGRWLYLQFTR